MVSYFWFNDYCVFNCYVLLIAYTPTCSTRFDELVDSDQVLETSGINLHHMKRLKKGL